MFDSLKTRLVVGAGVLTLSALVGACLAVVGVEAARHALDVAAAAERRINHLSVLSSQIAGYGLQALAANEAQGAAAQEQLAFQEVVIRQSFAALDREYARSVEGMSGLDARTELATRAMGVARMRAAFETMTRSVAGAAGRESMETALAYASAQIGPTLNGMLAAEYRLRVAEFARIEGLRVWLVRSALGIAVLAVLAFGIFLLVFVRPILARLDALLGATRSLAQRNFALDLPQTRDEFAPLIAQTRQLAEGLEAQSLAVKRDRERLNQIVAERTEALRVANARLSEVDANRRRFFADVSHELRTPLAVILSEVELGRRGQDPAAALPVIERRARQLLRRIEDLLRLARSSEGRLELQAVPLDLGGLAAAVCADFEARAAVLGVRIACDCRGPAPVDADPDWTRQIVAELVENALRHAASGGLVALRAQAAAGRTILRVIDNGPGINDPEAVFGRFARGPQSGGFGIGLAFARWVVEEQGGAIAIESPVPEILALGRNPGTCLVISFPGAVG